MPTKRWRTYDLQAGLTTSGSFINNPATKTQPANMELPIRVSQVNRPLADCKIKLGVGQRHGDGTARSIDVITAGLLLPDNPNDKPRIGVNLAYMLGSVWCLIILEYDENPALIKSMIGIGESLMGTSPKVKTLTFDYTPTDAVVELGTVVARLALETLAASTS